MAVGIHHARQRPFLALDPDRNVIGTFATMRDAARAYPGDAP
jgi:hypothetical protein